MRVVLDANVFASGVLGLHRAESTPGEVLRRWHARAFTVVTSEHLIGEVTRALAEPFFTSRIPAAESTSAIQALRLDADVIPITEQIVGEATHVEDDLVLATAISGKADILVTGDRQLLRLETFRGVSILGPARFIKLLNERANQQTGEDKLTT
jgi:putative PIN family toxin of toxin-antitoxin system